MKSFWISFVAAALAAMPILSALRAMKSRQTVSEFAPATHQVKQGTPTMGGLIVIVGMLAGIAAFWISPSFTFSSRITGLEWRILLSAVLLILFFGAIGFVDDYVVPRLVKGKRGLGWKQKILMQVAAAILGVLPLQLGPVATCVAVFAVLFCSNAYNFADGLDGLAAGIGLAYCGGLVLMGLLSYEFGVVTIALAVAGGLAVFLFLNAHPAKVFMGDVGSLPIGAVFGLASFLMVASDRGTALVFMEEGWNLGWPVPIALNLMLAAELIPVPIQVLSVKLRGKRVFPCTPIHHAFERAGWPETRVVAAFSLVQLLASALAFTLAGWYS